MSFVWKWLGITAGVLIVALGLGLGSAWWMINAGFGSGLQNGAWATNTNIGSPQANPYTRAAVARAGLLALNKSETVYFTAATDDAGEPLTTKCTYRLEGAPLATRWWSITAYGADHYLIPNPQKHYSQAMNTVSRAADNSFTLTVGPDATGENSIPTGYAGSGEGAPFSLTLRLYNPAEETYTNLGGIRLPAITRETCS